MSEVALTPSVIRDKLMSAAGLTPPVQAKILRRAVNTALKGLRAKKSQVVTHMGKVMKVVDIADNMAQLRAAELLADLVGAKPSKDANAVVKVSVEVNLPDWAKPTVIDTLGREVSDAEIVGQSTGLK